MMVAQTEAAAVPRREPDSAEGSAWRLGCPTACPHEQDSKCEGEGWHWLAFSEG